MNRIITAVVATLALAAAANAQIDFDKGVDIKSALEQAKTAAPKLAEIQPGIPTYTVPDCKKAEFTAESPLTSPAISLRSLEMYQNCQNFGGPVGDICTPDPEYQTATVKVTITAPRELKPGQKEVFEVCLKGPFLSLHPISTVYKYSVKQDYEGFKLTPQKAFASEKGLAGNVCRLVMDNGYTCGYRCDNGSYISKPNPFPVIPSPNPYIGPIATPCSPTMNNIPEISFGDKGAQQQSVNTGTIRTQAEQTYDSYRKYPSAEKAAEVMTWAVNNFKFTKARVTKQDVVFAGPGDYRFRIVYKAATPLLIESGPLIKVGQAAYNLMFDMENRLENDGATVVTHEVVYDGANGYYYVLGYFQGASTPL